MYADHADVGRRRAAGALATVAIHIVIAAGLIWGLSADGRASREGDAALVTVDFAPPPPPPPPPEQRKREAASAPATPEGRRGEALPVEAPPVAVPLAVATPAAPRAGEGRDDSDGAGASGQGTGAGGSGAGTGPGGDGGIASPARRIAGALRDSDYPRGAESAGLAGTVVISFRVRADGRVDRCTVVRSSGAPLLDDLTCRLFTARYRFRPATNARGEPVDATLQTSFTWGTRRR